MYVTSPVRTGALSHNAIAVLRLLPKDESITVKSAINSISDVIHAAASHEQHKTAWKSSSDQQQQKSSFL